MQLAQAQSQTAELQAKSATAASGMDLLFSGQYAVNGIDSLSHSDTWDQALGRQFPAWKVQLQAKIPLGATQEEAQAQLARTQAIRADALNTREKDMQTVEIQNRCLALLQLNEAYVKSTEIFHAQDRRHSLEDQRFKIGRSSLTQVVIASDDRVTAELQLKRSEVERRLSAWRVFELDGRLLERALGVSHSQ